LGNASFVADLSELKINSGDFKSHDHICHFFSSEKEKISVVKEYFRSGLEMGDKCLYIAENGNSDYILEKLNLSGVRADSAPSNGNLAVMGRKDMYLHQGKFDPDYIIGKLKQFSDLARSRGYGNLRIAGDMTRFEEDFTGLNKLMEYEAKLNILNRKHNIISLCQYQLNCLEPRWIRKAIQTHPKVLLKNISCENGYYVPPSEFLQADNSDYGVKRMLHKILKRKKLENRISNGAVLAKFNYKMLKQQVSDREKTLKVFQESESYFRKMLNAAPVAIIMTDSGGRCLFVNEYWSVLSGLTLQESIGAGWQKSIHPDDVGKIGSWWYRGEKNYVDPGTECRIISAKGDTKWVDLKSSPVLDNTGDTIGYIASFADITHYK
jgi:PAS domain S-box-containing protein